MAYYYGVTGSESSTKKTNVKNTILDTLERGDLIIYRRVKAEGSETGHVMLYVGDELENNGQGFIHATGTDYNFEELKLGEDEYSIRYDSVNKLISNIFSSSTSEKGSSFTILRPINDILNNQSDYVFNENVDARVKLNELRIEQYTKIEKEYKYNSIEKKIDKTLSQYNSLNIGDTIIYKLYFVDKADISFCTKGQYDTKKDCEADSGTWKSKSNSKNKYTFTITANVPNNTEFVSCTRDCSISGNKITWKVKEAELNERAYVYSVKVLPKAEKTITNNGFEIAISGKKMKLAPITTKINKTINGAEIDKIKNKVDNFEPVDGMKQIEFIKKLYNDVLKLDLGEINGTNIKTAIFNYAYKGEVGYYSKKSEKEIDSLTNTTYKKINKMLVKGMYGGVMLKGNANLDRANI